MWDCRRVAREFIALVIGEVSLDVSWHIASGFSFAGKRLSPTAHCASPPGKLRTLVKFEFSSGGFHTTVSQQPVLIATYSCLPIHRRATRPVKGFLVLLGWRKDEIVSNHSCAFVPESGAFATGTLHFRIGVRQSHLSASKPVAE